jgi:uncharacterized protein YdbL (DUF1318 family)
MMFFDGIVHASGIKQRMKERLPAISQMKAEGAIGENNQGFLEFLGKDQPQADLVKAENEDRKTVYKAIAKQQGTTPEHVGKRRALQIVKNALPGEWLQDTSGNWYQKK